MQAMEIIVAAVLLVFGLTIAVASYHLGAQWADDGPQAGYFPFYAAIDSWRGPSSSVSGYPLSWR